MQTNNDYIIKGDWTNYLSSPQEELLLVTRKHRIALIIPLLFIGILTPLLITISYFASLLFSFSFFLVLSLTTISFMITFSVKNIIEWYFNLYVITTKKILEVNYAPLSNRVVNSVLLDQVRCTEIDIQTSGILGQILDMGDVNITFDRPTRREACVLAGIKNPRKIGAFLSYELVNAYNKPNQIKNQTFVWFKTKEENKPLRFAEEIYPGIVPNNTS